MSREEFEAQIQRMFVLRNPPADIDEWWRPFQHFAPDVFQTAVDLALENRAFFPMPAELRQDVEAVILSRRSEPEPAPDRFRPVPRFTFELRNPASGVSKVIEVEREWRYHCDDCHDTARRSYWCGLRPPKGWYHVRSCDRRQEHPAHEWVGECACKDTNPEYRRWLQRRTEEFERSKLTAKAVR